MQPDNFVSDPFSFFSLAPAFALSEDLLRQRYFEVCQKYRDLPSILAQAHARYAELKDPVRRLDFLVAAQNLTPLPEPPLPPEVPELYDAIEAMTEEVPQNVSGGTSKLSSFAADLMARLEALRQEASATIPEALTRKDVEALALARARLTYTQKLLAAVYAKVYA